MNPVLHDEIVVRGLTLQGTVKGFDEDGIHFETIYGKGEIVIAYHDIQQLNARGDYRVVMGNGTEVKGQITGLSPQGVLLLTEASPNPEVVKREDIDRVVPESEFSHSWLTRLRNRHPHWAASMDLNWDLEHGGVKKKEIGARLKLERRKAPTRQVLDVSYATETHQTPDDPDNVDTVKDEYTAKFHAEWDQGEKWFLFVNPTGEHDAPRGIKARWFGAFGPGYRFTESSRFTAQLQVGAGWVDEQFFDYPDNNYFAAYVGAEWTYTFQRGVILDGAIDYFPGVEHPHSDWLLRGNIGLRLPIEDKFYINLRISDVLDNNPAPDVGDNKLTTTLGLNFVF